MRSMVNSHVKMPKVFRRVTLPAYRDRAFFIKKSKLKPACYIGMVQEREVRYNLNIQSDFSF